MADVAELGMSIGELKGDQVGDFMKLAGQPTAEAGGEEYGLPWVVGVEFVLEWFERAGL